MVRVLINAALGLYCFWNAYKFASISPMPAQGAIFGFPVPAMAYIAFWGVFGLWCLYGAYQGRHVFKR